MFEAHVLHLLRKYLGEYVEGLSVEALRISVWKGDVVLKDLNLKAEALNSLRLPVTVKAGFVGQITLKVPWKSLGKQPVIVLIDRVFVLAHPAPDGQTLSDEDREKLFLAKLQQIEEAEVATLEATRRSRAESAPGGSSWLGSLIATIIGNLKVTISNVHIRYEDTISNPGHPFCTGFTLSKLAATTMDEQGNEIFDTSGALDKLRKSLQLERLAVYHDSDCSPWKLNQKWEDLTPNEWTEVFQEGINENPSHEASSWALNRRYLLSPINGVLKYHRLGKQERNDPEIPFEKASLDLRDVSISISESQYYDGIKLLETFSRYKIRVDISHLRPVVPISHDPHAWWRFAMLAGLEQKKLCYWFSWDKIKHLCQLRRRYIQLYVNILQQSSNVDISEIRQIERILDSKVILLWRLLAHAKFGYVKSKEASEQKDKSTRSWWSFRWRSTGVTSMASNSSESQLVEEEKLTKEEWRAINEMLSYQEDEDTISHLGKDLQNMIQYLVEVSIGKAAARIIDIHESEIVCGKFEQLHLITKLYPRSIHCNVSLKSCGLSSPEGSLAESVISERKTNALDACFIHAPINEDVDWRLTATIAPCHVSILMESYDRLLEFVKRSNAVSPKVAMETASALQLKLEQVTRRAQEQIQLVLEERSRFALDIDLDAPKVRVPMGHSKSRMKGNLFLLDFGHFTLHTKDVLRDEKQSLYSRFYISGRDISAFFIDDFWKSEKDVPTMNNMGQISTLPNLEDIDQFYNILDRCGMSVIVDQIKVPHPSYPSTRVSIQVPNLGIHFSPERYFRMMELLDILYDTSKSNEQSLGGHLQSGQPPWHPVDLASDARTLVWRGFGNSLAEWQPCYLVLAGLYLYVLESEDSYNYQRCLSIAGRHVFEVPPASIDGSAYAIAISVRGVDIQKALESTNTLVIEFHDNESKATWLKQLVQATYRASAPPAMDIFAESVNTSSQSGEGILGHFGSSDLVINGTLVETKLLIYGKLDKKSKCAEELLIELIASGGKVNFSRSVSDLTMKMKLHSLKIKDDLQGHMSKFPEYLACSVLSDKLKLGESGTLDANEKGLEPFSIEEDDFFADALTDFLSIPEQGACSKHLELGSHVEVRPDNFEKYSGVNPNDAAGHKNDMFNGKFSEIFYEAQDSNISDFVAITFSSRNPDSPMYDGIDTQMSIRMSALEFFCNRPTLVALIQFGFDLSLYNFEGRTEENTGVATPTNKSTEKKDENSRKVVKGLLGHGKGRVVFNLKLDVDSVCVFLNMEDGSQLAMFIQESFLFDLKVYPASISIDGILGNMKLRDMTLGSDSRWGWLCDIHYQGIESLIKFTFNSYSIEDDDYQGYDYSLKGHLSAVRIVFLYRFVQEITSYFMELASPHTEEAIKLVDKVGGFEWLIHKYEMDGATAVKLDLSLDTPIIIVPKNSMSNDYMQLDLGHLKVENSLTWHGCKETDPSAIHLDTLHAVIHGINMTVGVDGVLGKPMIRDGHGIDIEVRRSLRDLFQKVPTLSVKVKVGLLHGVMSDKEYAVIINCVYMNLSEVPKLPPSFRGHLTGMESIRMLADKVNLNSQILLSHTIFILAVEVQYALLELCTGPEEGSPLAQIALEGLWVSYRTTSFSETDLYVTIPKFSVLDIRPDTKPEMRLMLGSHTNMYKPSLYSTGSSGTDLTFPRDDSTTQKLGSATHANAPYLTMLILDYRWRPSFQSVVLRIQQPRVLVVIDFLLALVEYFVPSLGSITGREETMNPKNDPIINSDDIILSGSVHVQRDQIVHLSPRRQLIIDGCVSSEFIYDGAGGTLSLNEQVNIKEQSYMGPIILIGRGKKLRFKNVKIKNAGLLRRCTYLSNGSSYSVSPDDGVELLLLETFTSDIDSSAQAEGSHRKSDPNADISTTSSQLLNVTFEAQIVSPEFTFYHSSKFLSNDSLHIEKLLRAKMDLSFMYASKENDTWARGLVKDFTIEAGSGLLVLAPVDISGGYTSVKEKTNISITSTNIYIHMSLSVASLLLELQNEVLAALQFGNSNPLASCSNFKRIWVSPKGDLPGYNLTFWRPQSPQNYAILGDCVTTRPIPPSQVVLAVSNTYGRVRKPIGFKFIGSISDILGLGSVTQSDKGTNCSIWLPIPPSGYSAVGCVAHPGNQPPPSHIVYCLRADLVTSTALSGCIYFSPPTTRVPAGFSIWRVDNVVGSFYAHNSVDCPPPTESFDLHQILHRHPNDISLKEVADVKLQHQHDRSRCSNSSGWDVLRSLSEATAYCMSTPHFERIWWDKGCELRRPISIWRPARRPGFDALGDCVTEGLEPPALGLVFRCDNPAISARPVQFTKVAHVSGKGVDEAFFWYPIPPPGYVSFGCVVTMTNEPPEKDFVCCPRLDLVSQANIASDPISKSSQKGSNFWSIWKVENQACTFLARSDHKTPTTRLAYKLSDYIKLKTRENVAAELKLGLLSLRVLDNFCGTMTPLLDTTVTNINLATHGHFEAMNAVLICSLAASTFNRQIEAWEPLIEPFDGILKMETYLTNKESQSMVGKHIRFSATSSLNLNISAANLETLAETILSWGRQNDFVHKSLRKSEEVGENLSQNDNSISSALDDDDVQQVVLENKLGCDVYLRDFGQCTGSSKLLQNSREMLLFLPTPRFLDELNVMTKSRESRYYVAIQILESKGLTIVDDGNSQDYFCALRLLIDGKVSDQYRLFPQSARTRCVSPLFSGNGLVQGCAKWNELFIFEVPEKVVTQSGNDYIDVANALHREFAEDVYIQELLGYGYTSSRRQLITLSRVQRSTSIVIHIYIDDILLLGSDIQDIVDIKIHLVKLFDTKGMANLQVEVTNLSSKAGKGEVIGALSIPVSNKASMLKRAASIKMLNQAPEFNQFSSYALRGKGQLVSNGANKDCGALVLSVSYIDQNAEMNFQISDGMAPDESDVGFLVGLGPDGPWESFSSVLPLSAVVPKTLDKNPIAFEVVMRNCKKHAVLRSLVLIVNDADIKLEVSLLPSILLSKTPLIKGTGNAITVTEEIFENQRYQPISGWGSKSLSIRANDPAPWSTRDYSYSSKDFFEPSLPSGWKWTSAWKIDKSQFVDSDGWAYGTDFQSFKWPPTSSKSSSKSPSDIVRKRRWIRTRQQLPVENTDNRRSVVAVLSPGSSTYLPWISVIKGEDLCLQVRPYAESSSESYTWGQMFTLSSKKDSSNMQPQVSRSASSKSLDFISQHYVLRVNQLEKKDLLLYCARSSSIQPHLWLGVGTDASVLHTELNAPVYDWKISINSALRLENKLPCEAEFAIWEKTSDGKMIKRQDGIIQSGACAFIYSADIKKPIYLTLFVQGGWVLEKDAVLVLDLLGSDHASSFWMVQQQTYRRLRVSVEHDLGGTDAAPKTIRFFVPYWIQNDSPVPLNYRIVEVEPLDNLDADTLFIPRAVKSAKFAIKNSSKSFERRNSTAKRNIQIFDIIEDTNPKFVMLSPQDYMNRSGSLSFESRDTAYISARVGISIAVSQSEKYCLGISLHELERKERVDFDAFASDGSYYRLSAQLKMASDRTKVVYILPRTLFINRIGRSVCLSQCNSQIEKWIHPSDPPMLVKWDSNARNELLRIRLDECKWSTPFSVENDGTMCVFLRNDESNDMLSLIVEVRGGTKSSRYEVVLRLGSLASPYRIENRSMFLPVHVRQADGADDSWQRLPTNSAAAFFWQDLGRQRLLEVLVDGMDPLESAKYNIDEIMESHPVLESTRPIKALQITVHKEGKMHIARINDWMPENDSQEWINERLPLQVFQPLQIDYRQLSSTLDSEFHVTFELTELGLSLIDHMPEEVLFLSVQNLLLSYSSGLGSGISRFKLRMDEIQIDNQLPFSPMPVLFRLQRVGEQSDFVLKFSMTMQTKNSLDFIVYPYIGLQVPDNSAFLINIHEPIIWRLNELLQQVKVDRILGTSTTAVSVDPIIKIGLLNISEIRFKVSMAMSPSQRPRGVLGFWSSLMTALGNMEHMPVRIAHRYRKEVCMRQSSLMTTAVSNIQKDLLSQPLQLLSGVDILGNASSALSNMSKGVAALSMDKKFIQSRQKQDSKGVEDIGDVIREGGGAFAKGLFRGVTGILTKPIEGAKTSGVEGFVQGVGKGLIGAATQPVSGVLDLLSKTTEGANAVRMKISSAIMSEEQLLRKRLPRAIGGDNLLRPYDEYKAQGQAILQLAECGTFFGQVDLFKVRGKFALSDAYEDHFLVRKGKILLVTHRRVLLLQQPTNTMAQRKFNPARDPCSVLWDVLWDDLVTMELSHGKKDLQGSPPSRLILYLQVRSVESNVVRVVKCVRGSEQAREIYSSIQQAIMTYGPHASKERHRRKVTQPYSPCKAPFSTEVISETFSVAEDVQMYIPMHPNCSSIFTQAQSE